MPFIRTLSADGRKRLCIGLGGAAITLLITLGVFASNDWLPKTDPMTGKRFGWFGKPLASNAPSSWNPIASVIPTPTPTPLPLSKEYLYAGSRLLAVEDANATAVPPADIAVWRPSNGWWYVMGQTGSAQTPQLWRERRRSIGGRLRGRRENGFHGLSASFFVDLLHLAK